MPAVSALYRYPVKGFTPERRDELVIQPDGRVAGDRVLAFRFADHAEPLDQDGLDYWPKNRGLSLMEFPSLARVKLSFDSTAQRLRIDADGMLLAAASLDDAGRRELEAAVTAFVDASPDARRLRGDVQRPIGRCAAIMANPDTGERDARLLRILTTRFDQDEPTLGILLLPTDRGGTVRVGDEMVVKRAAA